MDEIGEITDYVQEEAGYGTNLIWGHCHDPQLEDKLSVTLIATGFSEGARKAKEEAKKEKVFVGLDEEELNFPSEAYSFNDNADSITFDLPPSDKAISTHRHEQEEPIEDSLTADIEEDQTEVFKKEIELDLARREYLRKSNNRSLDDPKAINELESQPAYLRRNVELEDINNSKVAKTLSDLSVGIDSDQPIEESKNSFLHDNVD